MGLDTYDIGDRILLSTTFLVGTTPTNPSTVTLKILYPDGTEATFVTGDLDHAGTGVYTYTDDAAMSGLHRYSFAGTGSAQSYEEGAYYVRAKEVP